MNRESPVEKCVQPDDDGIDQDGRRFSNVQPLWKVVLFTVLTFGAYPFFWFYRNWKHFRRDLGLNIHPIGRFLGVIFVPFYGLYLIYQQFKDIKEFAESESIKSFSSPGLLTFGIIAWNFIALIVLNAEAVSFGFFLLNITMLVLVGWFFTIPQRTLNTFWAKKQHALAIRSGFSLGEIILVFLGSSFWIFVIYATVSKVSNW